MSISSFISEIKEEKEETLPPSSPLFFVIISII